MAKEEIQKQEETVNLEQIRFKRLGYLENLASVSSSLAIEEQKLRNLNLELSESKAKIDDLRDNRSRLEAAIASLNEFLPKTEQDIQK